MNCGQEVCLPTPTLASDIQGMLAVVCRSFPGAEVYIRVEDCGPVLYAVRRLDSGRGVVLASRPIPMFPEEA